MQRNNSYIFVTWQCFIKCVYSKYSKLLRFVSNYRLYWADSADKELKCLGLKVMNSMSLHCVTANRFDRLRKEEMEPHWCPRQGNTIITALQETVQENVLYKFCLTHSVSSCMTKHAQRFIYSLFCFVHSSAQFDRFIS